MAHTYHPALKRQGQEDCEFKASMGYPVMPCLFKNKQNPQGTSKMG